VFFLLRTAAYRHVGYDIVLSRPTNIPSAIMPLINRHLDRLYRPNVLYRLTGVVLSDLRGEGNAQLDLFGEAIQAERLRKIYEGIDQLDQKYGTHTVFLGSSLAAMQGSQHQGERAELPRRRHMLLKGEDARRRLGLPLLGEI
jgi:hypothetical protein